MKIYVAARFTEKELVRKIYSELQEMGHTITADWTAHENVKPYNVHSETAGRYAEEDLTGTITSDIFLCITNPKVGAGLSSELGAALASNQLTGKPHIFVVGEYTASNAFHFHPSVQRLADLASFYTALEQY